MPTPPSRKRVLSIAAVVVTAGLLASACGSDLAENQAGTSTTTAIETTTSTEVATELPALADTYEAVGNADAEVVLVNTQGGPMPELATDELQQIAGVLDLDETYVVNVHQAQTIASDRFVDADLTFDEAKQADAESVAMLAAVVQHFVDEGKQVYLLGISFGAFMTQELLVTQGNIATGYLIMVGRLDMPEEVWTEFAEGRTAGFEHGTEVIAVPIEDAGMGAGTEAGDRNMARLAAGLGHNRYTVMLAGADLANVVYAYGDTDEQVGRLSAPEIEFLESAGANVLRSDRGHGGTIDEFIDAWLKQLLGSSVDAG